MFGNLHQIKLKNIFPDPGFHSKEKSQGLNDLQISKNLKQ